MFFAIGFETTAPSTAAHPDAGPGAGHRATSRCSATTSRSSRRSAPSSTRPTCGSTPSSVPGHVSTVIGCRPYEWIARDEGQADRRVRIRAARPAAVDRDAAAAARRRPGARSRTSTTASCRGRATAPALAAMAEVFELRPYFEWRGLGFISQSALRLSDAYAEWDAERRVHRAGRAGDRPQGGAVRRGAEGRAEAGALQAVRQGVHAGAAGRRADGVVGRLVRRLLQLRASQDRGGGEMADRRHQRPRSHGAGGDGRGSAIRRSRWRTAPAARPAAAWSKGCSRRC